MNQIKKEEKKIFEAEGSKSYRFLLLSLFIHLMFLTSLNLPWNKFSSEKEKALAEKSETVIIELSDSETSAKKQIVETDFTEKSKLAAKDAFLGAQTQTVDQQTKATKVSSYRSGKVGGGAKAQNAKPNEKVELSKLGVGVNLKPMGNMGPAGELAATNDFIENVKDGSQTMLNTKEFAFFGFYQRVRRQLEQFWEPGLRNKLTKMLDRGRTIASEKEHNTKLVVVLNPQGEITRIQVENTSGLVDLDEAAIEAFNKAGPFPNPPKEMIERDGTVKVAWEFVLRT